VGIVDDKTAEHKEKVHGIPARVEETSEGIDAEIEILRRRDVMEHDDEGGDG